MKSGSLRQDRHNPKMALRSHTRRIASKQTKMQWEKTGKQQEKMIGMRHKREDSHESLGAAQSGWAE